MFYCFYSSIPHHGLPSPVRERMRKPDHLRDNERSIPCSVRGGSVLSPGQTIRPHERCVSLLAGRMPSRQENGTHVGSRLICSNVKVSFDATRYWQRWRLRALVFWTFVVSLLWLNVLSLIILSFLEKITVFVNIFFRRSTLVYPKWFLGVIKMTWLICYSRTLTMQRLVSFIVSLTACSVKLFVNLCTYIYSKFTLTHLQTTVFQLLAKTCK